MSLPTDFTPLHILSGQSPSTPVLAALSGGADSSAMLHMLCTYAEKFGTPVYAAHINHMIRGAEADRDEQFCRDICKALGVEIFVLREDVPRYAREKKVSVETAAREIRYAFFDKIMCEHSIPLLATAHNACDNLETVIFNITRGAGLDGVCGILPTRKCAGGTVVRPILGMSRDKILEYCREHKISFVTDSTNTDTDYTRNKIRASIVPELLQINPAAVENAARMSRSLREDALCLEGLCDMFCEQMREDASFDLDMLIGSPASVVNRALMSLYSSISGGACLERVHIDAILRLCRGGVPHSRTNLPHGIDALIENGALHMVRHEDSPRVPDAFCVPLYEGENFISQINAKIIIGNSQNAKNIYKTAIPMYLDFDTINGTLVARERRAGDKIKMGGVNKSVKKLLCDRHIPFSTRYRLPMLCVGETVVAIPTVGVADGHKCAKDSAPTAFFLLAKQ